MLILFDLDDTLMDDGAAERSAALLLHKTIETAVSAEEFASRSSDALKRHFARYLAGEVSFQGQPDPAIFVRACASAGELPENSVYVGDRYDIDAQAARRAGLRGIWLDRKRTANASHTPPIVGSLGELLTVIVDGETLPNHRESRR